MKAILLGAVSALVLAVAAHAGLRTARKLSYENEFAQKAETQGFDDFFIYPNVWTGFGYIGIPPGCALVGSYENVVARIREYNALGIDLFFLAGYPHLEEAYRLGEHVLPHFRSERVELSRSAPEPLASISGTAPNSAASVVIRIGRKRSSAAW